MAPESQAREKSSAAGSNGYGTDQSMTQLRRSRRSASVVTVPNMSTPSSNSWVAVSRPATQKRRADPSSNVDSVQSTTKANKKKSKPNSSKKNQVAKNSSTSASTSNKAAKTAGKPKKGNSAIATEAVCISYHAISFNHFFVTNNFFFTFISRQSIIMKPTTLTRIPPMPTVQKTRKKNKEPKYANILDYFEDPTWREGDPPGTALMYKCKWCPNIYRSQKSLRANLKTHRDGSTQSDKNQKGCLGQDKAKQAGIMLPPSVSEKMDASKNDEKQPGLTVFLKPTFVNRVLNQLLMMWQIRQALPWSQIKDPFLRAAFQFSNPKAVLYGRRWSADEAKKLYLVLKSCVFDELNVC
jgi:hypothetical protein